jgi:diacylglycerol kinase family enzyme
MQPPYVSEPPMPRCESTSPAPPRIAVVVNGNARSVNDEVISTLDRILAGGDLFVSRRLSDVREIAKTILGRGYSTVLTGGGDGTFTVVVTAVIKEARRQHVAIPRFGLLKLGTGNALAWVVGATSSGLRGLTADIERLQADAGSRSMHLIEVEGQIAPFCGFGADAQLLADYDKTKSLLLKTPLRSLAQGFMSYGLAAATRTIPSSIFLPMPHVHVTNIGDTAHRLGTKGSRVGSPLEHGDTLYEGPACLVALSTIPYWGFGFRAFPYANERTDRMQLRISTITAGPFLRNFKAIWRGEYEGSDIIFDYLVSAVRIDIDPPCPFQIGGDYIGIRETIEAALTDEPIRLVDFYAPPSAA